MAFDSLNLCPPGDLILQAHRNLLLLLLFFKSDFNCTLATLHYFFAGLWEQRVPLYSRNQAPQPSQECTHPCHRDREGNSEVFLKVLFKPKMSPPPKPPFLWGGGRRLPFKEKGIVYKFLWKEKKKNRWGHHLAIRTFLLDVPMRFPQLLSQSGP